jgi:[protein-PII] uridylyltransferase
MSLRSTIRDSILQSRERLRQGRAKLAELHQGGALAIQVAAGWTDVVDGVVLDILEAQLPECGGQELMGQVAVVALGGYGRRDLAPFSDVDLMLLHLPRATKAVVPLARGLSQDVVDVGLSLGFSVRTPTQACRLAWQDASVFTSLAEARLIHGSIHLFSRFMHALQLGALRRQRKLVEAVAAARNEERVKFGESGFLLRPNVKRSRGALRDLQLVRWIGFARYGHSDPEQLVQLGDLPEDDHKRMKRAHGFLLRLRNELHLMAGKSQDVLDRAAQLQIAQRWGYQGGPGVLPVEAFMREYFEHTSEVRYATANFLDSARYQSRSIWMLERAMAKRVDGDFRMGWRHLWIAPERLQDLSGDLASVLHLLDMANEHRRRIDHPTWQAIRTAMRLRPAGVPTGEESRLFLQLMAKPHRLADLLRRLHELRVLEQLVPAMAHARCLLQFNEYHKYTVDAHSIRAVEAVTKLADDQGEAGELYRRLKDKRLLHLALLIHDLGKGHVEDHSELGEKIALETAARLQMSSEDGERMARVVRKHLLMTDIAFRHDLNDPQILLRFINEVGSVDVLELLLLHTLADLTAVGPDVLTDWKQHLLVELYLRASSYFREGRLPTHAAPELEAKRSRLVKWAADNFRHPQLREVAESLAESYLRDRAEESLQGELQRVEARFAEGYDSCVWGQFDAEQGTVEYTAVCRQVGQTIGTFARVTGALAAMGQEILRSEIQTVGEHIAWDRFWVRDSEGTKAIERRIDEVSKAVQRALDAKEPTVPQFRQYWRSSRGDQPADLQPLPSQVRLDNSTSDRYTIISFFTYDRPGLLYQIAMQLVDLQVVLQFAKIGTYLDQVVDVFYVTELNGSKLTDPSRQSLLRERLLDVAQAASSS